MSFEVGIHELGGQSMFLGIDQLQLGRGETVADTAMVLCRYLHGVVIRSHEHEGVEAFAAYSSVPVINGLTDRYHPCQLVADLQTIAESAGRIAGVSVAYLGDGASNMANSWAVAASLAGIDLRVGAPVGYQPDAALLEKLEGPGRVTVTDDPVAAVAGADFVYTDVWVSMGSEEEEESRIESMNPFAVTSELLSQAKSEALFMHCMPTHPGMEVSQEVLDSPQTIIFDQAENRLHAQKAILEFLLTRTSVK